MKLFLSDLDGTLLSKDHMISKEDCQAIQSLSKNGFLFGIATGRDYGFCKRLLQRYHFPMDIMILNNGGSLVVQNQQMIEKRMKPSEARKIFTFLKPYIGDLHPFICDENGSFYFMKNAYDDAQWNAVKQKMGYLGTIKECDLSEVDIPIIKISICIDDADKAPSYQFLLQEAFSSSFEVLMTSVDFIEFTKKGVHKGSALLHLEKLLQLPREDVIFIGDGENDISLLKLAGYRFVMDTATDNVKRHGDKIVHSVAEAILSLDL